jgi:hypothetical protein
MEFPCLANSIKPKTRRQRSEDRKFVIRRLEAGYDLSHTVTSGASRRMVISRRADLCGGLARGSPIASSCHSELDTPSVLPMPLE